MASIAGLNGSSTRAVRTGTFRSGGIADANACPHRAPVHPMLLREPPDRQILIPLVLADRCEQLHPRLHPGPFR